MFKLPNIDPIIVDAAFISILVLILFFGIIRGFKSVLINILIVAISLFLGFSPYMNSVKKVLITKVLKIDSWAPAGSTSAFYFGLSMLSNVIASVVLTVFLYIILRLIKTMIGIIITKKRGKPERRPKSKAGRVFAGLLNLVFGGALLLVAMLSVDNNIVSGNKIISKTKIVSVTLEKTETLLSKANEDLVDMIVLRVYKGDVISEVDYETIESYHYIDDKADRLLANAAYIDEIEKKGTTAEEIKKIGRNNIYDLYDMAIIAGRFDKDANSIIKTKFQKVYRDWMVVLERNCKEEKIDLNHNEAYKIEEAFKEAGIDDDSIKIFKSIINF